MRRIWTLSLTATAVLSVILPAACSRSVVPDRPAPSDIPIYLDLSADAFAGKSLFEPGNFNTPGNQLTVYDKLTIGSESSSYIDGAAATCDGIGWNFDETKYWTRSGVHSFTAYASYNAVDRTGIPSAGGKPIVTYDSANELLTVSAWRLDEANQFDFVYGRHTRSMSENNPYRPVELRMKHLFCAVQFNLVQLIPGTTFTFKSFSLTGTYRTGSAGLPLAGDPVLTLSENNIPWTVSGDRNLGYNVPFNLFSGIGNIGTAGYVLMWPHTQERFTGTKVSLRYAISGTETTKEISLAGGAANHWRAGYRYIYNFYVQDNKISFEVKVLPWIVDDVIIDE